MGEACWFAEPGPEQQASGLTHIWGCWMLYGMETDRSFLHSRSTLLLPRGRMERGKDHLFILAQVFCHSRTPVSPGSALTRVCCPDVCGCHQRHLSVASLWWPVGLSLAGPTELEPAENGSFRLSAPRTQPEAADRSLVFLSKRPICLSRGFWFDANL